MEEMFDKMLEEIKRNMEKRGYGVVFECQDKDFKKYKVLIKNEFFGINFYAYLGTLFTGNIDVDCNVLIDILEEGHKYYCNLKTNR